MGSEEVVTGVLRCVRCPGYRSPFRLVREGDESPDHGLELNGDSRVLRSFVDQPVRVRGVWTVVPGGPAPEGSEAASRFVHGMVPELAWFEVISVEGLE